MKTQQGEVAYAYVLLEHQSSPDYWIALRLWKYSLSLLERHAKNRNKLPLVCPLVLYNGSRKYKIPLSFWDLFEYPEKAKTMMGSEYRLVDLQAMKDDEINYSKHVSMALYLMKHIHMRDAFKLVENVFKNCREAVIVDKDNDYVYTKYMIWYTDSKVDSENKQRFEQAIVDNLPKEEGDNIMYSIADYYVDQGKMQGIEQGIEQGIRRTAVNMLIEGDTVERVAKCTGLSQSVVNSLKTSKIDL